MSIIKDIYNSATRFGSNEQSSSKYFI